MVFVDTSADRVIRLGERRRPIASYVSASDVAISPIRRMPSSGVSASEDATLSATICIESRSFAFMSSTASLNDSAPLSSSPSFSIAEARAISMRVRQSSAASSIRARKSSGATRLRRGAVTSTVAFVPVGCSSAVAATVVVATAVVFVEDSVSFTRRGRFATSGMLTSSVKEPKAFFGFAFVFSSCSRTSRERSSSAGP